MGGALREPDNEKGKVLTHIMSTLKRKLRVVIPAGIAAVTLSVASFAYACTTMGGQLFVDHCRHATGPNSNPWTAGITDPCGTIKAGDVLGVYASWVPTLNNQNQVIQYHMAQDQNATYCHPGYYPMTQADGTALIYTPDALGNIGTDTAPMEAQLRTGRNGKGGAYICFSDGGNATWPEWITVS